jgi:hypothetical protein
MFVFGLASRNFGAGWEVLKWVKRYQFKDRRDERAISGNRVQIASKAKDSS